MVPDYLVNAMIGLVYEMIGLSRVDYIGIALALVAAIYALRRWKNIE
jgi:hypothetical protein